MEKVWADWEYLWLGQAQIAKAPAYTVPTKLSFFFFFFFFWEFTWLLFVEQSGGRKFDRLENYETSNQIVMVQIYCFLNCNISFIFLNAYINTKSSMYPYVFEIEKVHFLDKEFNFFL